MAHSATNRGAWCGAPDIPDQDEHVEVRQLVPQERIQELVVEQMVGLHCSFRKESYR